jgi:hypothetical protein
MTRGNRRNASRTWELSSITDLGLEKSYAKAFPDSTSVFTRYARLIALVPTILALSFVALFSLVLGAHYNNVKVVTIWLNVNVCLLLFTVMALLIIGYVEVVAPYNIVVKKFKIFKLKSQHYADKYQESIERHSKRNTLISNPIKMIEVTKNIRAFIKFEIEDLEDRRQLAEKVLKGSAYAMLVFTILILIKGGGVDKDFMPTLGIFVKDIDQIKNASQLSSKIPEAILWVGLAIAETFLLVSATSRNEFKAYKRGAEIVQSRKE